MNKVDEIGSQPYITPYHGKGTSTLSYADFVQQVVLHTQPIESPSVLVNGPAQHRPVANWMIFVLLLGFSCLAYSRSLHRKRFSMLSKTLFNWKLSKQIIRYEKVYTHPVNILMTLNFILCFPFFFSIARSWMFHSEEPILWTYAILTLPLLCYLLVKIVLYRFSGWLFGQQNIIEEYIFQTNLFNKYLGLGFLILTTLLLFSPLHIITLVYAGGVILTLSLVFQIIRGIIIGIENGVSLFFIITYLCTLEITPWLLLGKWVKINM